MSPAHGQGIDEQFGVKEIPTHLEKPGIEPV
jgi:hypothetical protein